MTCKDVTEKIDLGQVPPTWVGRFRLRLHLSFCQACKNYFDVCQELRRIVRGLVEKSLTQTEIERLNQELIKKFAKPPGTEK